MTRTRALVLVIASEYLNGNRCPFELQLSELPVFSAASLATSWIADDVQGFRSFFGVFFIEVFSG
jgi:hypothetical protein